MSHIKGFFKKITGDSASYETLCKQPILDAEVKLNLFKEATSMSISGLEAYVKLLTKSFDLQLSEKFFECRELFKKYESKGDLLNPNISHIMGIVFGKLMEVQQALANDVNELGHNIEVSVLKPLIDFQKEIAGVKENRKELKEAYDRIEQSRQSLEKARKEVDSAAQRSALNNGPSSRLTMMTTSSYDTQKRLNDLSKLEDKVQRVEKELDEATLNANEKYDKYTEGLYKRIADECELTNYYLEYLKLQRAYHKQALKRLDALIPGINHSLFTYLKKPIFGCSLNEYVNAANGSSNSHSNSNSNNNYVSPVIRKIIEAMCKQNVFNEEGIFRIAGSRIKMNCLLYAINAGYLEHLDLANDFDVHCLAGVLKQYIRELPDSLLCDEFYHDWLQALDSNSSLSQSKLDSFREVLQRLPRANFENLRYLIKFLAKIVENSDKTKMTTTNMGICFGVSLLSASSSLNSSSSSTLHLNSSMPNQTDNHPTHKACIDMNTATTVFDFLLTNHLELFPGDMNFSTGQHSSSSSSSSSSSASATNSNSTLSSTTTPMLRISKTNSSEHLVRNQNYKTEALVGPSSYQSNRYSVMINENEILLNNSPLNKLINSTSTQYGNYVCANNSNGSTKHAKKGCADLKTSTSKIDIEDHNDSTSGSSPPSSNSNNSNNSFIANAKLLASQIHSNSTVSLDAGSSSPKTRPKKQAPAPPKLVSNDSLNASFFHQQQASSPSVSMTESPSCHNYSPPQRSNTECILSNSNMLNSGASVSTTRLDTPNSVSMQSELASSQSLLSRITNANLAASTMISNNFSNNSNSNGDVGLSVSPLLPTRSSSFKTNENLSQATITSNHMPKPNIPPPSVPSLGRTPPPPPPPPPPIGFNLSASDSNPIQDSALPYPAVSSLYPIITTNLESASTSNLNPSLASSSSSASSSIAGSISIGSDSNHQQQQQQQQYSPPFADSNSSYKKTKPPKPVVPRKPGNIVAQHLSKFESSQAINKIEDLVDDVQNKSQEITFL